MVISLGLGKHTQTFGPNVVKIFSIGLFTAGLTYTGVVVFLKLAILALYWRILHKNSSIRLPVGILTTVILMWGIAVRSSRIGFFGLPAEIRNEIYNILLVIKGSIYLERIPASGPMQVCAGDPEWASSTMLLRVSRQMHHEAAPIAYGRNTFVVSPDQYDALRHFLTRLGPLNASLLRTLIIDFPVLARSSGQRRLRDSDVRGIQLLQQTCTGLKRLGLEIHLENAELLDRTGSAADADMFLEYLPQVDAQLQGIPSLEEIRVQSDWNVYSSVVEAMHDRYGWITDDVGPWLDNEE
ncbi:hypothetical protein F4823DRAFT_630923 [Ustulina deusta]|nr:hypothetical protein F4823DRAFT_630923 [Ustulina deusta]